MIYPTVQAELIRKFFEAKGYKASRNSPFSFTGYAPDSPVANVDVESELVDLNHLGEDWASSGSKWLFDELIQWLGADPYV